MHGSVLVCGNLIIIYLFPLAFLQIYVPSHLYALHTLLLTRVDSSHSCLLELRIEALFSQIFALFYFYSLRLAIDIWCMFCLKIPVLLLLLD